MSNIPEVPWRFGERYLATDFVTEKNIAVSNCADNLWAGCSSPDDFISDVAVWVRDNFYYPLDSSNNPSAGAKLFRHNKSSICDSYHFKKKVYYAWSFPCEVINMGCGICIDTANLTTSLLRNKGIECSTTLGDVRSTDDHRLLGRHAWTEVIWSGQKYIIETTIHEAGVANMVLQSDVYNCNSQWAKDRGVFYQPEAGYTENSFTGEGPLGEEIVSIMGLPANRVLLFGIEKTLQKTSKVLHNEWAREERMKTSLLREAYGY